MRQLCKSAYLLFLLGLLIPTQSYALKPELEYRALPSHYGIVFEEVTFIASDGLPIRGWFFPAQDTAGIAHQYVGRLIPMPPKLRPARRESTSCGPDQRPTIVICDGDAGNMTYLILYAYHFCTSGYNVLTFDWRGFGESGDWSIEADRLVYSEFLLDFEAAIDYAKNRPETDPDNIGLFGFSTGAYLSFAMAAKRDDISAVVGRGIITSFKDVIPILKKRSPDRNLRAPRDYPAELLPVRAARGMKTPTLLVVGEADDRTPVWMSQKVYDLLQCPKELWVVPNAGHGGASAPEYVSYPAFFRRISAFYRRFLEPGD